MKNYAIYGARIVNEGKINEGDVFIKDGIIESVGKIPAGTKAEEINAEGKILLPGVIDDQVHFREPGLTHKADIGSESRAAVAGGITSFMEMPNTVPNTLNQELLQQKYDIAAKTAVANFSFYMGASNDNIDEVLRTEASNVCGVKVFMGSSTGNMLVDSETALEKLFSSCPMLIASHCEDEETIRRNTIAFKERFGEDVPMKYHPMIRNADACYRSSSRAVALARKHNTRLHVLHISTAREIELFDNSLPVEKKRITAEACTHHLWFTDADYESKGTLIKWNPAVKTATDREAIIAAVNSGHIDVIATDHAPHTLEEKNSSYFKAPSGGPLVQHNLVAMLELVRQKKFDLETIVEKMCHAPAKLFRVRDRGYVREGYRADLVLVDENKPWKVSKENLLYKCRWSPFEGTQFQSQVTHTFVNGNLVYENGNVIDAVKGERMLFSAS